VDGLHDTAFDAAAAAPVSVITAPASGNRGRAFVAVWLMALVGIAGAGAVGRLVASGDQGPRTAVVAVESLPEAAAPIQPASPIRPAELIVLASPAEADVTVTTRELVIWGYVGVDARRVRVTLEARGNRVIDDVTVIPVAVMPALTSAERPNGDRHAHFEVRFGLPNPRPNGRMIVQVAAYDVDGTMIDVVRRPIRVGPLAARPLGEDGLLGGLAGGD